jgi:hypothetical protein
MDWSAAVNKGPFATLDLSMSSASVEAGRLRTIAVITTSVLRISFLLLAWSRRDANRFAAQRA